jgi:hypothetical protein
MDGFFPVRKPLVGDGFRLRYGWIPKMKRTGFRGNPLDIKDQVRSECSWTAIGHVVHELYPWPLRYVYRPSDIAERDLRFIIRPPDIDPHFSSPSFPEFPGNSDLGTGFPMNGGRD